MFDIIMEEHEDVRKKAYPEDETYVTVSMKRNEDFNNVLDCTEVELRNIVKQLGDKTVPFYSQRYQGHMAWDTTMAGQLGYLAAMQYNQNNVAWEGKFHVSIWPTI